jgi:hypothetical protein
MVKRVDSTEAKVNCMLGSLADQPKPMIPPAGAGSTLSVF